MATDFTGNGPITGAGQVWVKNGDIWELANVTGPGYVLTEITDGVSFTPPDGAIGHLCYLWGPGDEEPRIAAFTTQEMGASATVNIGTEADGTDSTFNPAGSGATLTAPAGQPNGWHLLESTTLSSQGSYTFDFAPWTDYIAFRFELVEVVPVTDSVNLRVRVSTDGGSTFESGASDYEYSHKSMYSAENDAAGGSYGNSYVDLLAQNTGQAGTGEGIHRMTIETGNPHNSSRYFGFFHHGVHTADNNATLYNKGAGTYNGGNSDTSAVTDFRLFFSSGNISSGSVRVMGMK